MGIEIERKFLVDADPGAWASPTRAWEIRQGYVTPPGSDPEVRVREARPIDPQRALRDDREPDDRSPEAATIRQLTTKASTGPDGGGAVTRVEVEVDVDDEEFRELWAVTSGRRIEKARIEYALGDDAGGRTVLTVDHFRGALDGLVLAEIEFADADASRAFVTPPFLGTEVSEDRRYRNAALAATGAPPAAAPEPTGDAPPSPADGFARPAAGQGNGMAFRIATDEPLGEGLRRCARDQLEGATDALERRLAKDPGKAIHDARKRIKKTRALLRLSRPAVGRKVARRENATLRSAAASLAAARDADVMVQTVDALAERYVGQLPAATFEAVRASLAGAAGPGAAPSVDAALEGLRGVLHRADDWPLAGATADDVLAGEGRAYASGRAQLPAPGDRPTAEELHEWRKRVKDLWYHGLLLQSAWPPVMQAQAEEAHRLSEVLGDDHDLSVLRDRLGAAPVDDPTADVDGLIALIDRRRDELLDEALTLGRRVYAETPKAHAKRLRGLVAVWQESVAA